jgi:hypothetical protein
MTVCTNHVALGDLIEDRLPFAVADAFGDVEVLGFEVVELEDQGVGLAAVDAGVAAEELNEVGGSFGDQGLLVEEGFRDVSMFVRGVVFLFVGGSAGTAVSCLADSATCGARRRRRVGGVDGSVRRALSG